MYVVITVNPPLMDTCIKDTIEKPLPPYKDRLMVTIVEFHNFEPPKRGQPLYKGQ